MGPPKKGKIELERNFLDRFDSIVKLCKEKDIKMFTCLGDPEPTRDDKSKIEKERKEFKADQLETLRTDGIHRYEKVIDSDLPIYEPILPIVEPTWDYSKNNTNKIRKMRLNKLMGAATKIVIRGRVENRLNKIRKFLGAAASREDVIRLVNEDWNKVEMLGLGKKNHVRFEFQFNDANLTSHLFAVQYENKIDQISETYNSLPTIGFDDLAQITEIKYNDSEVLEYKAMDPFGVHLYPPVKTSEIYRTGAEEEYPFRGRIGPIGDLRKNPEDMVVYTKVPDKLLQPPTLAPYKMIYHQEFMRKQEELGPVTEADSDYMLRWEKVDYFSMLHLVIESKAQLENIRRDVIACTVGFDGLRYLNKQSIEKSRYWRHEVKLSADIFADSRIERHCPDIIYAIDRDDVKSDDESEDENDEEFKLMVATQEEFNVEKLDPKFQDKVKEAEENEADEEEALMENLNKMFEKEKLKSLSMLPTMTTDYNKYIKNASNKLFII